ncbi:hypothetical protein Tco_0145385 [Tanacetum coccineum]
MEHELWNLKVKEYDVVAYTQRFNELALMCPRMVEPKRVKVDTYIQGLMDTIKGEVTSSKPADLNEAVRMAHKLMEQKSQARDARILEGKKQKIAKGKEMREPWLPLLLMESFLYVNDVLLTMLVSVRLSATSVERLGIRNRCSKIFSKKEVGEVHVELMLLRDSKPQGDKGVSLLKVISCIKACKYVERGCHLFLARDGGSKSKEKQMEDMLIIHDFPKVFPEEFPRLPPPRQVKFRIDLVPRAAPVARAPYRLAPSEMK